MDVRVILAMVAGAVARMEAEEAEGSEGVAEAEA